MSERHVEKAGSSVSVPRLSRWFVLAAACVLSFHSLGCGGASSGASAETVLPPADPAAVREFVAGVRAMARPSAASQANARRRFEAALAIDPNLWEAHYNLGVLHRREMRLDQAVASFESASRIAPREASPAIALAEAHYAAGRFDDAADVLRGLIDRGAGSVDARVSLATVYREAGSFDRALEQAREVLVRDPGNVGALVEVGRIYRAREQYDVAMLVFQKALALVGDTDARKRAIVLNEQGLLELERGDTQAAFQAFGEATAADPRFTPARRNQGAVLLRAGDYASAAAEYEAVLAVDASDSDARVALGVALRGMGDHRRAQREYTRVLEAQPNHIGALFDLAVLRAAFLDQRPRALRMFRRFLELAPPRHARREAAEQFIVEIEAESAPPPGEGSASEKARE
jgi:tetratricopeptide (TPR) repeat protein